MTVANRGRMLTVAEVAEQLSITDPTVYRMINHPDPNKRLKAYKVSERVYRIAESDLDEFFERVALRDPETP